MTMTIAKPTCAVRFDEPTEYVDRNLATASWWDRYIIQPGTYAFEWQRNGRPWNADMDKPSPGFIANVGPEDGVVTLDAVLVEQYRVNRVFTASSAVHTHLKRSTTISRRVYAYQLDGCPGPHGQHGPVLTSFLGGCVIRLASDVAL